jgi:hypothetical protein
MGKTHGFPVDFPLNQSKMSNPLKDMSYYLYIEDMNKKTEQTAITGVLAIRAANLRLNVLR